MTHSSPVPSPAGHPPHAPKPQRQPPERIGWPGPGWIVAFLRWFFQHLYTTLAFAYDTVAWLSSFGAWDTWRRTALHDIEPGPRWLEIGCGTGHLLAQALAEGHRVVAIDASRQMARIASHRLRRLGAPAVVARAEAQALPFPAGIFAACVSTFPSEYIFDPRTQHEVHRVMSRRGRLVVVVSARIRPRLPWEFFVRWLYESTGESPVPNDRWLDPARRAGFAIQFRTVQVPGAEVVQAVGVRSD